MRRLTYGADITMDDAFRVNISQGTGSLTYKIESVRSWIVTHIVEDASVTIIRGRDGWDD